ncbi:MAG: diaminopropionate ammonia-lyase [Spartobacteria bacterium]
MNRDQKARFLLNPQRTGLPVDAEATSDPLSFHRRLPGYSPTPLHDLPGLARSLGIGQLLAKNESSRLGLPAFKILGASWAVYRALEQRTGKLEPWQTMAELAERLAPLRPFTLATATDGNHGRAVAHMAALLGLSASIYVPLGTAQARIDGIASEGATVKIVKGTYDDAVQRVAQDASDRCLVVSDTSWPGYEEIPQWVTEGYATIMAEIDDALAERDTPPPDLIAVPFGVGALAAAVVRHNETLPPNERAKVLSVEPLRAACMLDSMAAGELVTVPGPHNSIMAGLNCGRPSIIAWPIVSKAIDGFIAIPDERARQAMRALAREGIVAGETGAASLAGLIELLTNPEMAPHSAALEIDQDSRALVIITEGATDPRSYREIVSGEPTRSPSRLSS